MYQEKETKKVIAIIVLMLIATVAMRIWNSNKELKEKEKELEETNRNVSGEKQKCTVDGVSFYVDGSWFSYDGQEGAFTINKGNEYFGLQDVTSMWGYEPEQLLYSLVKQYQTKYTVNNCSELEEDILSDGTKVYLARIEAQSENVFYVVDVLFAPDEDKMVSYGGQCWLENAPLSFDVREITKTTVFHEEKVGNTGEEMNEQRDTKNIVYGNDKEENDKQSTTNNIVIGNTFYTEDSEIQMNEDGSFIYYQLKGEYDGTYCSGNYEAYCGQEAIDKIISLGGETTEMGNDTIYIGNYVDELKIIKMYNAVNMRPTEFVLKEET